MEYSDVQLGHALGVHRSTAFRWRKAGMPTNDLEAAKSWAQNRKPNSKREPTEPVEDVKAIPVAGESCYDVRDRLQMEEQSIASEIAGLNTALQQARLGNDEKNAFKLVQSLKSAREDHRRQVDALLKSEARILLLEKNRGSLVDIDVCKSFISSCLVPTIIWMRKLADAARNAEERSLLENLRDAGLAVINASAREAANFDA